VKPLLILSEEAMKKDERRGMLFTYMGNVQRPGKANNTRVRTVHAGTMDRGFTV
jgi:hypothetical protein